MFATFFQRVKICIALIERYGIKHVLISVREAHMRQESAAPAPHNAPTFRRYQVYDGIDPNVDPMMGCDDWLVERIGRKPVLDACAKLGCSMESQQHCVPHPGYIDLCQECYDAVKRGEQ